MDCKQARSKFSSYLDGAVSGVEMRAIATHMERCGQCRLDYAGLRNAQEILGGLQPRKAPAELALRLQIAIHQERARRAGRTMQNIGLRIEHAINSFMLPATAGLLSAVIMFGVLIGFFALPSIGDGDIPTSLYTPPKLAAGPYAIEGIEAPVVIEANVAADGRVMDYQLLAGPRDSDSLRVKIDNALIFTTFEPARAFGKPASGRVVLAFSTVNVKG